jgi:Family of unknown function (DUF6508)
VRAGRDTGCVADAEPGDEEIVARLRSAGPAEVAALRAAADEVRRTAAGGPLATWPEPQGDGSARNPLSMPYPVYHPAVDGLTSALVAVGACPAYDWRSWPGVTRPSTPADVAAAPLADVARLVTAILRGERFTDGVIGAALESGVLLAAADRILAGVEAGPQG